MFSIHLSIFPYPVQFTGYQRSSSSSPVLVVLLQLSVVNIFSPGVFQLLHGIEDHREILSGLCGFILFFYYIAIDTALTRRSLRCRGRFLLVAAGAGLGFFLLFSAHSLVTAQALAVIGSQKRRCFLLRDVLARVAGAAGRRHLVCLKGPQVMTARTQGRLGCVIVPGQAAVVCDCGQFL